MRNHGKSAGLDAQLDKSKNKNKRRQTTTSATSLTRRKPLGANDAGQSSKSAEVFSEDPLRAVNEVSGLTSNGTGKRNEVKAPSKEGRKRKSSESIQLQKSEFKKRVITENGDDLEDSRPSTQSGETSTPSDEPNSTNESLQVTVSVDDHQHCRDIILNQKRILAGERATVVQLKQQITMVTQSSQQQVTALEKTVKDCKKTIKDGKKTIETQKGTITALRLALQEAESENQLRRRPLTAIVDSSSLPAAAVAQQVRHDSAAHKANQKKQASSIYTHFR